MRGLIALIVIGIIVLGVVGTTASSTASNPLYRVLDEDEEFEELEGEYEEEGFLEEYMDVSGELSELKYRIGLFEGLGYNISMVYQLVSEAEEYLDKAYREYRAGRVGEAYIHLREAKYLIEAAEAMVKGILRKGGAGVVVIYGDEDDIFEYSLVNGILRISSSDNLVELGRGEPEIEFKYTRNNTEVEFSLSDIVFIEFIDENGNGRIDPGEVLQRVSSSELRWRRDITNNTFDGNTEIIVSYYTNSAKYEIEIVMHIYKYSVAANASIGDKTLTIYINGGADQVKYDLIIYRWPWRSNVSLLALYNDIEVEVGWGASFIGINVGEEEIVVDLETVKIAVSWVRFARVGGDPVNVSTYYHSIEVEAEEGEAELELGVFFIYPYFGGDVLVHDPSIGVVKGALGGRAPILVSIDTLVTLALTAVLIAIIATILVRKGYITSLL